MNEAKSHYYVISDSGKTLDPQGDKFNFQVEDYEKTFDLSSISSEQDIITRMEDKLISYAIDSAYGDEQEGCKNINSIQYSQPFLTSELIES
ncbi:hypothetical protein N8654_04355 [Synechococcus sp. AH-601-B19]|nr:hypothetical protein [Synechococcus sp. AH-601-B19]